MKNSMIVIVGPTATGKTALAVQLAKAFNGEVVSADSMQVYKGLNIGTAKPDETEMQGVPHHLIDAVEPGAKFSVSDYVEFARKAVDDIYERGKLPIVAGGTGLYIDSLVSGVQFADIKADEELREDLKKIAENQGGASLKAVLEKFDKVTADRLHENDTKRIVRAIEIYMLTGEPMSVWEKRSREGNSPYNPLYIGLRCADREILYNRINKRVDKMIEGGLASEVKGLLDSGLPINSTAMQAIGYKEMAAYLQGTISFDAAVEKIKQESRQYAKRQMTWFKRNQQINWFDIDQWSPEIIYENCKKMVENSSFVW